jgi:hypothetical protein
MAEMADGYGSECHLLRFLGRHRECFDKQVCARTGAQAVNWLDFHFDRTKRWKDAERKGLDFLRSGHPALTAWAGFWPSRGNSPNWDAVGIAKYQDGDEWLLVEAKAHVEELFSDCKASEHGGLPAIKRALESTKSVLGIPSDRDWLQRYYQYANRLTILNFLRGNGVPARLLFVYFTGDSFKADPSCKFDCPKDEAGWKAALQAQSQWLGLEQPHPLADYVHKLFVPIVPV